VRSLWTLASRNCIIHECACAALSYQRITGGVSHAAWRHNAHTGTHLRRSCHRCTLPQQSSRNRSQRPGRQLSSWAVAPKRAMHVQARAWCWHGSRRGSPCPWAAWSRAAQWCCRVGGKETLTSVCLSLSYQPVAGCSAPLSQKPSHTVAEMRHCGGTVSEYKARECSSFPDISHHGRPTTSRQRPRLTTTVNSVGPH
jgi:hypothetical protein